MMKRYFEVIFDDSASMNEVPFGWTKTVADAGKEIFEAAVFPHLNGPDDVVTLRLLRETPELHQGCEPHKRGVSPKTTFIGDPIGLGRAVNDLNDFVKWTPLYLTIRDALDECKSRKKTGQYSDFKIFILTDGDDTCDVHFDKVCSQEEIDAIQLEFPLLEPVLVQLNINNPVTRNNLNTAIRRLGGRSVSIPGSETTSIKLVSKALRRSNFSGDGKLPHCIEPAENAAMITWNELEGEGILFHQAEILSKGGLLSFTPELNQAIHRDLVVELRFLHAMVFRSFLPIEAVRSMVSQLERPLLFTHDCIQWDFFAARWKFKEQLNTEFTDNPTARDTEKRLLRERLPFEEELLKEHSNHCTFSSGVTYIVNETDKGFQLRPEHSIEPFDDDRVELLLQASNNQSSTRKNGSRLSHGTKVKFIEL